MTPQRTTALLENKQAVMSGPHLARILVVDDEAALVAALCNTLKQQGYQTFGFTSSKAALAALREGEFHLLLTDLMMPVMDGMALLRAALEIDPYLVGVMITGEGTVSTAVEAMRLGALDYVLKPFRPSIILAVVARALNVWRLRHEKVELERQVRERTTQLEAINKELKSANADLEAFGRSVSHDLRAPLRAVHSLAGILAEDYSANLPVEARDILDQVLVNAKRMGLMMEGLLRLSRIGQHQLSEGQISVSTLVNQVLDDLRKDEPSRAVEVCVGELPDCVGDATLLRQVFYNLLSNAFKFTSGPKQALVEVGCEEQNGAKVYFVRDNGAGFDMQHAQKLFGVFERLHGAQEFEGTGVGLSIVGRIIERHGGHIWAQAAVGQGATFYFRLGTR